MKMVEFGEMGILTCLIEDNTTQVLLLKDCKPLVGFFFFFAENGIK